MADQLQDSVVVITGAGSGIGLATALAFADAGASVVLAGRQAEGLRRAAAVCNARSGNALAVPTDVTKEQEVEALARSAVERFGHIDVWVNNAAVTAFGRFEDVPPDVFRQVMETNFFGYVHGIRAVLPYLTKQGHGLIVNIASDGVLTSQPYAGAYIASKAAVRALSDTIRMELMLAGLEDVHVSTVLPPSVDTPLFQRGANYMGRAAKPMPPVYDPERIAAAIVRLAHAPQRELIIGLPFRIAGALKTLAPQPFERMMARSVDRHHFQDRPVGPTAGNVFQPVVAGPVLRGGWTTPQRARGPVSGRTLALAGLAVAVPALLAWQWRRGGLPFARTG